MARRKSQQQPQEAAQDTAPPVDTAPEAAAQAAQVTNGNGNGQGQRKPPVFEARLGRIKAVVWENQHPKEGRWFSITLGRSYKDEATGNWKTAHSLGRDDLLVAGEALRQCYLWIMSQQYQPQQPQQQSTTTATATTTQSDDPIPF